MIKDYDIEGVEYTPEEPVVRKLAQKRSPSKARRLVGVASLAFLLVAGALMLAPSLRKQLFSRPPQRVTARSASVAPALADSNSAPLLEVPSAWARINLRAMPSDVEEDLELGKYYYDRRLPGNFGLAIHYWQQAFARREREELKVLVASAERELARQFSGDSVDAFVLLKQGNRSEAVLLLERMRADYLDITAPQYVWTSKMLRRFRPRR
ncbi:MAG: hypothetical protein JSU73_05725 [candidate division WOR-3 bacterium]|nr:MAG: hypothetical protein JSU73_05725 [candidate division WOR-3 bacterium]